MKAKKPDPINLPYQSNVASFARDQGAVGSSFLGDLWKKRKEISDPRRTTNGSVTSASGAGMLK